MMAHNLLIAALPEEDLQRLQPLLTRVTLEQTDVIGQPGKRVDYVYFPEGALGSILATSRSGDSVEAAAVGREGVTAFPDVLARGIAVHAAVVQGAGEALRMEADAFRQEFNRCAGLHQAAVRYMQYLLAQSCQVALCNRFHPIDQRLAKWLLLCSDAIGSDDLVLTQEFMATMLGVQRPGLTGAAHALKEAESIDYTRGHVRITNRRLLESFSCECYPFMRRQRELLLEASAK